MTQISQILHKGSRSSIAVNITLSLLLLMPTVALAGGNNSDDPPPKTTGTSGGSRGCETQTETSLSSIPALILLAPTQRYGQTVATRPTFAWFVRDSGSWQMEFRLYEYDPASKQSKLVKEIKDENFKSTPGIMALSVSSPELSLGKRYLWQVELVCDANRPSGNPFAIGAMKVVPVPPDLNTKLSQTNDLFSKATLYAQGDLWYNALGIVLAAKDEPRMREIKMSLIEQVAAGAETAVKDKAKAELTNSAIHQLQR
ncbi:MAG TPA: DUF928 domain-containing protein [Waterburya sp.]